MESICCLRGLREGRVGAFLADLGSNRAHSNRRLESVLSLASPRFIPSSSFVPFPMSFVARQALSVVRIQIRNQVPEIHNFF